MGTQQRRGFVADARSVVSTDAVAAATQPVFPPAVPTRDRAAATVPCVGEVELVGAGIVSDGSGSAPYEPDAECTWVIGTAGSASAVSLSFSDFALEAGYDFVKLYNWQGAELRSFTGTNLPP